MLSQQADFDCSLVWAMLRIPSALMVSDGVVLLRLVLLDLVLLLDEKILQDPVVLPGEVIMADQVIIPMEVEVHLYVKAVLELLAETEPHSW